MQTTTNADSEDFLRKKWNSIQAGLDKIYESSSEKVSFDSYMNIYTEVYMYCTSKECDWSSGSYSSFELYSCLEVFLQELVTGRISPSLRSVSDAGVFLQRHASLWSHYKRFALIVDRLFQYLNQYLIVREEEFGKQLLPINTLVLRSWNAFLAVPLMDRLRGSLEEFLYWNRSKKNVNSEFNASVSSLVESLWPFQFDPKLEDSVSVLSFDLTCESFYLMNVEAYFLNTFSSVSRDDFLPFFIACIEEEEKTIREYFHPGVLKELLEKLYAISIVKSVSLLISLFQEMLKGYRLMELSQLYLLVSRVPKLIEQFEAPFEATCKEEILSQISALSDQLRLETQDVGLVFVRNLIEQYNKYRINLVNNILNQEYAITGACFKVFKAILNQNALFPSSSVAAEYLAHYADSLLKSQQSVEDSSAFHSAVHSFAAIFEFLENKDRFLEIYVLNLTQRLISHSGGNDDHEQLMVSRIRDICGFEFTSKLQKLLTDNAESKRLSEHYASKRLTPQDCSFQVLCSGSWPKEEKPGDCLIFPEQIAREIAAFETFYLQSMQSRKVQWLPHRGSVKVLYNLALGDAVELVLSFYQAAILLQFGEDLPLGVSFSQLQSTSKFSVELIVSVLCAFLQAKILLANNVVSMDLPISFTRGVFFLNQHFIPSVANQPINLFGETTPAETPVQEKPAKSVEQDRLLLIQSAIMRFMKASAQNEQSSIQILQELSFSLRFSFVPTTDEVKKCLDTLAQREFLQLQPSGSYLYLP